MDTYFFEIWTYFVPRSRLVKRELALVQDWSNECSKDSLLLTFLELSFSSRFRYPFERSAWETLFMRFGAILALVQALSNQG